MDVLQCCSSVILLRTLLEIASTRSERDERVRESRSRSWGRSGCRHEATNDVQMVLSLTLLGLPFPTIQPAALLGFEIFSFLAVVSSDSGGAARSSLSMCSVTYVLPFSHVTHRHNRQARTQMHIHTQSRGQYNANKHTLTAHNTTQKDIRLVDYRRHAERSRDHSSHADNSS